MRAGSPPLGPPLAKAWGPVVRRIGAGGDVSAAGARILAAYADPERGYHNLTHLDEVLRHVDELAADAVRPDVVRVAAWYHDVVYEPARQDNEARSADYAERDLGDLGVPSGAVAEVVRLVLLTATHAPEPEDRDGEVFCDADLAVLAADPVRYADYAAGVRREYAALDQAAFRAGRAALLRSLLARPTIYRTGHGRVEWEAVARRNIAAELPLLSAAENA